MPATHARPVAAELAQVVGVQRQVGGEVLAEDVAGGLGVGPLDLDLHVEAAGPQDRRVDHVLAVGGADDEDVLEALDAVDLAEQLRDDGVLDVGGDPRAAGAEQRVHLVEEHDDRGALAGLLPGPLEDQPDVPLGLADVLVEQLGALDVEEVALALLAGLGRHLLGQRVRDRLGDQRLAAAGRAVEQHALGRLELVLHEQVGVQVGQLDGVADRLDLADQPADVVVVDVGDLLEDQLLDLGLRDPLVDVAGAGVEQQRVAGAERLVLAAARRAGRRAPRRRWRCTRARSPSASSSLSITTSPTSSNSRAATTLRASLSMTSWPCGRASRSTDGLTLTRSLRPPVKTSTESSSLRCRKMPKPAGGWASRSTSSLRVMIWSRASRSVWASRSFWEVTAARERWVSASRCSSTREDARARRPAGGAGRRPRPRGRRPGLASLQGSGPSCVRQPGTGTCVTSWGAPRSRPYSCRTKAVGRAVSARVDAGPGVSRRRVSAAGRRSGPVVVRAVGTRGGAALLHGRRLPRRQPPGGDEEAGVAVHRVARADGEALDVPVAHQRLPGCGSVNPPCTRIVSTILDSWVVVAT